jgi:phosphoribosylaminoimidazole (AIR) synthetase
MEVDYTETDYYAHDKLFQKIQLQANLTMEEMRDIFNCGIGMVMIIAPEDIVKLPIDYVDLGKIDGKSKDR